MRRLVTGVDAAGRSCVVSETPLTLEPASGTYLSVVVYTTESVPPPPRPRGHAGFYDLGVAPGVGRWLMVEHKPNVVTPMHHTDTVDFDMILAGTVDLELDDGAHPLQAGDCVVITGVDHAWRAGPAGCRLSVTSLGTPPLVSDCAGVGGF
jgi:quercetin dioxygenase-like cupin family protein